MICAAGPYATSSFRRIVAERLSDSDSALGAMILGAARALQQHGICPLLRYAGAPPSPIELTVSAITDYIVRVRRERAKNIPSIFRLSGDANNGGAALFLEFETTPSGSIDFIWVSLPASLTESADSAQKLLLALGEVCLAFGAYHGGVEDELLMQLYRADRAAQRARSAVPPELRKFIPEPLSPITGPGTFLSLLVPQEFDRRRVPDAVWWINFWDAIQVQTVGLSRIETAGFARVLTQPSGALLLLATEQPINVADPEHLQRLSSIIEHLELRRLQEGASVRRE